jgi:hypothetical protein
MASSPELRLWAILVPEDAGGKRAVILDVIVRLDRTIQYSRGSRARAVGLGAAQWRAD